MCIGFQKRRDDILLLLCVGIPNLRTADPQTNDKGTGLNRLLERAERVSPVQGLSSKSSVFGTNLVFSLIFSLIFLSDLCDIFHLCRVQVVVISFLCHQLLMRAALLMLRFLAVPSSTHVI